MNVAKQIINGINVALHIIYGWFLINITNICINLLSSNYGTNRGFLLCLLFISCTANSPSSIGSTLPLTYLDKNRHKNIKRDKTIVTTRVLG